MKHTPGVYHAIGTGVFGENGYEIADCASVHLHESFDAEKGHWGTTPGSHRNIPKAEEEANARLIVQAVNSFADLLAALDTVLSLFDLAGDYKLLTYEQGEEIAAARLLIAKAKAAIAKATRQKA